MTPDKEDPAMHDDVRDLYGSKCNCREYKYIFIAYNALSIHGPINNDKAKSFCNSI